MPKGAHDAGGRAGEVSVSNEEMTKNIKIRNATRQCMVLGGAFLT